MTSEPSQPSTSKRLRALAKRIPDESRTRGLIRILAGRHVSADYPIAILGSALLERALESAILSRFISLTSEEQNLLFKFEQGGPLADFGKRIRFAYALGLFGPKTYQDLLHIVIIRNLFAHSPMLLGFSEQEIKDACAGFHTRNRLPPAFPRPEGIAGPQGEYITACMRISAALRNQINEESKGVAPKRPPISQELP